MAFNTLFFLWSVSVVLIASICFPLLLVIGSLYALVLGLLSVRIIYVLSSVLKGVMMKIKFHVLGAGETSFHSSKSGKDYRRVRLMGLLEDAAGIQEPATADLGFDVSLPSMPKSGDVVLLDLSEFSMRSAMAEMTFKGLEFVPGKK